MSANTPTTYDVTGLTALDGDDVLLLVAEASNSRSGSPYEFSASCTSFTQQLATANETEYPAVLVGLTDIDVDAGATGTLAVDLSADPAMKITPAAIVLSLPLLSFASWNQGFVSAPGEFIQQAIITEPTSLCGGDGFPGNLGSIIEVFCVSPGTSGSFTVNACATLAEASSENQIYTADASDLTVNTVFQTNPQDDWNWTPIVISSVPEGGEFGVRWQISPDG